jgi:GT2 family glycosyltransferase
MPNKRIAILILFFNDIQNVKDVLESTTSQTYLNNEIICIDNASSDGTTEWIRMHYAKLKLIENKENLGFAKAYRIVIEQIFSQNFDAAVLLNSDTIVDRDWLSEMVITAYKTTQIGIVQPKIYLFDGKENNLINTFGNCINYLAFGFCNNYKKLDSSEFDDDPEINYASGCSLFIKREVYESIGNLDDNFYAYSEDTDLCWRARLKGWKIVLSSNSIMWHKYSFAAKSTNKWKFFMLERNRWYLLIKNYRLRSLILISPVLFFMELGVIMDSMANGYFKDKMKSYLSLFKNLPKLAKERRIVQNSRTVNDKELFKIFSPIIDFEEKNSVFLSIANKILKGYYVMVKPFIK